MNEENDIDMTNDEKTQVPHPPGLRKLLYRGKKAGGKVAKSIGNSFKLSLRKLWLALPSTAKIWVIVILVLVIFFACAVVVLADYSVNISDNTISNYVSSSISQSDSSASFYNQTGSLLLMKDADIKNIATAYLDEVETSNYDLHVLMEKQYGSESENTNNEVNLNEKKSLYEHFLNTEKYNFNRITWVKYDRSTENGTPQMKVDTEIRLKYPEDSENTSLQEFARLYQPYMQNYIIPYSLYSGLITDTRLSAEDVENGTSKQLKFGYELLKSAYHDIQVNQYNMESYTKITSQNTYDVLSINVTQSKVCSDGSCTDGTPVFSTPVVVESCKNDPLETVSEFTTPYVKYKLKYAKVFDKYIINEYQYTEYNLNNESDDQTIERTVYKDSYYKQYENKTYSIPSSEYDFDYDEEGNLIDGTYTASYTFEAKKGYNDKITYVWKDTVEQLSHEERAYTVDDVKDAIDGNTLSSSETAYYEEYEYKTEDDDLLERLNTFDLMNANKDIYKNYLREGENYSENIGYTRSWMTFSFYTLKQSVKEIMEKDSGWKYFYGSSIGADEATISASSSTPTTMGYVDYSNLPPDKLGWPSPGNMTISSYFGSRSGGTHRGIDISMPTGSQFVAAGSGKVVAAVTTCTDNYSKGSRVADLKPAANYCGGGAGNYVKIKLNDSETYIIYMHMTEVYVENGEEVTAGQVIGTCGSTGRSTGPHAHFEVRVGGASGGYAVDPCGLFDQNYCGDTY